jgi:hypothetical protein
MTIAPKIPYCNTLFCDSSGTLKNLNTRKKAKRLSSDSVSSIR